jgi:choline dehydrogenase-like flavoprotein
MRSGIGPASTLADAGIATVFDLPEVGRNLHDHLLTAGNVYTTRRDVPPTRLQHSESLMYLDADDPSRGDDAPDVALACVVIPAVSEEFTPPPFGRSFSILSGVAHPTSRGCIAPTGPDLDDPPLIDPAYLRTEHDRLLARRALALARAVGASAAMADWVESEALPGADLADDAALDAFIARAAITHHHPVGTCALGQVVDADLAVKGLDDLFVVDASVIPAITSGPIHASVLAIAETFAAEVARRFA